jgi:hypothetical protein
MDEKYKLVLVNEKVLSEKLERKMKDLNDTTLAREDALRCVENIENIGQAEEEALTHLTARTLKCDDMTPLIDAQRQHVDDLYGSASIYSADSNAMFDERKEIWETAMETKRRVAHSMFNAEKPRMSKEEKIIQ